MSKFKSTLLISLFALVLTACNGTDDSSLTSTSDDDIITTTSAGDTSTSEINDENPELVKSVLEKLQEDSFSFDGDFSSYATNSDGELVYSSYSYIKGYYSSDRYVNIYYDDEGYDESRIEYYKNADTGYIEARYLDPTTNQTITQKLVNSASSQILYDSLYYNPWWYVDNTMGAAQGNVIYFNFDSSIGSGIFGILTNYLYDCSSAQVYVDDNGDIEYVYIETDIMDATYGSEPVDYYCTFLYEFIDFEEVGAYSAEPREATDETQALQEVFDELKKGNYTADISFNRKSTFAGTDYDYTFEGKIIASDDAYLVVTVNDPVSTNVTNGQIEGYVADTESSYQYVEGNISDGVLSNTDSSISGGYVSQVKTEFSILAEMFDYVGDNTYVYANDGTEDFLYLTNPDYDFTDYYNPGGDPDVGSFTITLNSDGTVCIDWTSRAGWYGTYYYMTSHTCISKIGTTTLDDYNFTINFFEPPRSWAEIEGAQTILDRFDLTGYEFPWFDDLYGTWTSYNENSAYGYFRTSVNNDMTVDEIYEYVDQELKSYGWVYEGINIDGEYMYTYTKENGYVVGASVYASRYYVWIYICNAFNTFFQVNFGQSVTRNYTLTSTYNDGTNTYTSVVEVEGSYALANGTSMTASDVYGSSYTLGDSAGYGTTLTSYDSSTGIYTFDIANGIVRNFYYSSRLREDFGVNVDSDISSAVVTKCELNYDAGILDISVTVGDNITIDFNLTIGNASII